MAKVTLADVAKRAGVGKATASRALNGLKGVRPETRQKVEAAAKALAFVPDPVSQQLSARRQTKATGDHFRGRLAYVDCPGHRISDDDVADARLHAKRLGYDLEHATVSTENSGSVLRQLWMRGVEGLLVRGGQGAFPLIENEWMERFPKVVIGGHPYYQCPKVAFDFVRGIDLAYETLRAQGAKRIGFWVVDDGVQRSHLRTIGAVRALEYRRHVDDPEICLFTNLATQADLASTYEWISQTKVDALVGPSTRLLERIRSMQADAQKIPMASLYGPPSDGISNVGFQHQRLHQYALKLLVDLIKRSEVETSPILVLAPPIAGGMLRRRL